MIGIVLLVVLKPFGYNRKSVFPVFSRPDPLYQAQCRLRFFPPVARIAGSAAHHPGFLQRIFVPAMHLRPDQPVLSPAAQCLSAQRSEARRVGKECVRTCRARWYADTSTKKNQKK